ncbi:hypothetical protein Q73_03390 [Bacillus coahuilensis m2-6]|uniref:YheC/YheD family protein n=1 Tax=Bacillus coahuilensis TaxID=408580 RepID=UPI00075023AB|nr:YheC/YheD family protein [Bacillus coahuilensis]KUP09332.1 hypothetical protein Q73_03390 [Bacillus coahuilensis m2-6]
MKQPMKNGIDPSNQKSQTHLKVGVLLSGDGSYLKGTKSFLLPFQEQIQSMGGTFFLFSLKDWAGKEVNGTYFHPKKNTWVQESFSFPTIIYNRLSRRKEEESFRFYKLKEWAEDNKTVLFNSRFLSKDTLYTKLNQHPQLCSHLPPFIVKPTLSKLNDVIDDWNSLYIKPISSSQGKGILKVLEKQNAEYIVHSNKGITTLSKEQITAHLSTSIIQKTVESDKIEGRPYDLRVLAHFNGKSFAITGTGVRVAGPNKITTHIPCGGHLLPFSSIQGRIPLSSLQNLVETCGVWLNQTEYERYYELSFDIGVTKEGKLVLYEINSKPMTFDEKWIEEKRMESLIRLCTYYCNQR